jgi:uncharacterized membrane protein YhaH (DUF805 family)
MVDKVFMNLTQLLFDDEGVISRREWRVGTLILVAAYFAAGFATSRAFGARGLDEPLMLFVSIAMLIPFYAVNAKRFRATERSPNLALWGGAVPALSALSGTFLRIPVIDIAFGWLIIGIVVWYIVDLGFFPHDDRLDTAKRIDAAVRRA